MQNINQILKVLKVLKILKIFIIQDKELLIYLMIIQKLDLKPFMKQTKMELKEQDLKY